MAIFKGAGVAITTPFKNDGSVDYDAFKEQIEYQIKGGTDAIIVCGTTGEAATLSHEEHLDVIEACVKYVNKRIPVIAGTGSNCTETAIYLSQEAEKRGVDGLLVVTPYYNKATQNGLKKHFKMVAESVNLPIILYNIPGRTGGVNIQPDTLVSIVKENKNIVGVKDATGNLSQAASMIYKAKKAGVELDVYSGNDDQVLPLLSIGGIGVISVLSNIAPKQTHDMVTKYLEGDVKTAKQIQIDAIELIASLFCEVNPIPVKKAMELQKRDTGYLRMPLTEMEEPNAKRLEAAMKEFGVL